MAPDDQLNINLERILGSLREQLDGSLRTVVEEIVRTASAERERAVIEATADVQRRADQQAEELREAGRKQADEVRATAEVQIAALRNMLDETRLDAHHEMETSRRTLDSEAAAARVAAASEADEARRVAQARIEELERQADDRVHAIERDLAAARAELALARSGAELARSIAPATGDASVLDDLARALRSLDEARSLSAVFEQLAGVAMRSTERCVLFLVQGDRLRAWRVAGFERDPSDIPLVDAGLVGAAVRDRRLVIRRQADGPPLPPFAGGQDRDAAAIPVTVAGVPVAVLYADSTPGAGADLRWSASLEVVTRHAARVLETVAVQQATGILTAAPMARRSHPESDPSHPGSVW